MLSILIPIYNFDISRLVEVLHEQAVLTSIDFEIICFDDGSRADFKALNRMLAEKEQVQYVELPENMGRSKIRNELAKVAKYTYLLFMDCDSKVVRDDFIQNYLNACASDTLVYGGRVYNQAPPEEADLVFHWHYGRAREQVDYRVRQKQPYHAFQTNNFLIPRRLFLDIQFEEALKQYGHEDTLFGFELKRRGAPMLHIDNPLEHLGLESVEVFLNKTEKGLENLLKLSYDFPFIETKLLKAFRFCKRSGLGYVLRWGFGWVEARLERKLRSGRPDLRYFDVYKLGRLLLLDARRSGRHG